MGRRWSCAWHLVAWLLPAQHRDLPAMAPAIRGAVRGLDARTLFKSKHVR